MPSSFDSITSRFSWDRLGADGLERLKHITPNSVASKSSTNVSGAEQERYQAHFGLTDPERARELANNLMHTRGVGSEQEIYAGKFSLGFDGKQRLKSIVDTKGVGAEQDRYGGYFGMSPESIERAKKKLAEGVKRNTGAEVMS